ncbi:MAG: response regulator transcription factor [Lachnospiraceae bacterium]
MLKLIIADDERIIRETIANLIDWNSLGIELIGSCSDGIEAYNMILDESPDIVLTDIRMPGLSGLELVERIAQTSLNIQFILLSGFGEFEYAKTAMKYKVQHYLLKPCNEEQIIDSMKEVIREYYRRRATLELEDKQRTLTDNLHHSILSNIINDGVSLPESAGPSLDTYSGFMDFFNTGYELCYLYYLEEEHLQSTMASIYGYMKKNAPGIPIYSIYVKNTLMVFFESHQVSYEDLDQFLSSLFPVGQTACIEYQRQPFGSLSTLLEHLLGKIRRYGIIYFLNGLQPVPTCNYKNLIAEIEQLTTVLTESKEEDRQEPLARLKTILEDISNPDFFKQLASSMIIKLAADSNTCSPIEATQFLMKLNQESDAEVIRPMLYDKIQEMAAQISSGPKRYSLFIEKVMQYVEEHLSNPNLTLKWISENYLYMNVDYVSKRFIKETEQKFSNYLTNLRIQKAKALLAEGHSEQIQWIAEQVGCGNNPQYFSQIFKKNTGLTPSAYAKKVNGG